MIDIGYSRLISNLVGSNGGVDSLFATFSHSIPLKYGSFFNSGIIDRFLLKSLCVCIYNDYDLLGSCESVIVFRNCKRSSWFSSLIG